MASGQRAAELPGCIDFSTAHKFWMALLTELARWWLHRASSHVGKANVTPSGCYILQIEEKKALGTFVSGENVPCVFWTQTQGIVQVGSFSQETSPALVLPDLRLSYHCDFCCDRTCNPKGHVPAVLHAETRCQFLGELAVEVGELGSGKWRIRGIQLSILSRLGWLEGAYSISVTHYIWSQFITCSCLYLWACCEGVPGIPRLRGCTAQASTCLLQPSCPCPKKCTCRVLLRGQKVSTQKQESFAFLGEKESLPHCRAASSENSHSCWLRGKEAMSNYLSLLRAVLI